MYRFFKKSGFTGHAPGSLRVETLQEIGENFGIHLLMVISTVFIPLSFILGLYGMNFVYMPELQWKWGYFAVWVVMILVVLGMLTYFRRKKWI